jgi:MFS family permease
MFDPPSRTVSPLAARRPKLFYGWWMAWAYFVLNFYWGGTLLVGFSALFNPIRDAFGLSATMAAAAISLKNAFSVILAPLVGYVFDRYGPRPIMFFATFVTVGGLSLLVFAHSTWLFFLASAISGIGLSAFIAGTGPAAMTVWFIRNRGKAIAIVLAGSGLGAFLMPPIVAIIDAWGWRVALAIIIVALIVVTTPLTMMLRHRPEQYGLRPDGRPAEPPRGPLAAPSLPSPGMDFLFGQALRARSFWLLVLAQAVVGAGTSSVMLFIIPHLEDEGFSTGAAAWAATALGIVGVFSTLGGGWLADLFERRRILVAAYFLQAGGVTLFAFASSVWHLVAFVALFGIGSRLSSPVAVSLLGDYFGRAHFGKIQGVLFSFFTLGAVAGPLAGAIVHDIRDSFTLIFVIFGGLTSISVVAGALATQPILPSATAAAAD